MSVAIIGSGKMGAGLARLLASKGFGVAIGNRSPEKAVALAKDICAKAKGGTVQDAVSQADIILLAVPLRVTCGHRRLPPYRQLRIADDAESYRFRAAAIILRIGSG
jgi:glycerol-3-phosphate dehydrogenase